MKAARIREYNERLVLEDVPIPDVQLDEVLVQVQACGMCRSDVQLVDGYFRKYNDIPTPIIPGHEITGLVHTLGGLVPQSSGLQEGDHVVVAPGCDVPLFPRVSREQTFHGSFWGNYTDLSEVMVLAAQGKIRHTVKTITFDQINEYIERLRTGEIVGRAVIKF